ncbi:MAG: type II toxin-antitoxin system VapB family antitoxin [Myxococcales bacterium]|nr:type II toxin-antitoxin system VapB family antitoxin [Myxococcales bacterium]
MRTTIDIPDDLLREAVSASRLPTKRDAVIEGLKELIRRSQREELRRMAGTLELNVDLRRSRKRR